MAKKKRKKCKPSNTAPTEKGSKNGDVDEALKSNQVGLDLTTSAGDTYANLTKEEMDEIDELLALGLMSDAKRMMPPPRGRRK
ncbi:MAG: hypothetical protein ACYC63_01815 [Armatimonadota bacterium]